MIRTFSPRSFPIALGLFVLFQASCTFPDPQESETVPSFSLQGRWRQDSGHVKFYNGRGQFLHQLQGDARESEGFMTIGPEQWHFWNGRNRATWAYTRRGGTLVAQRLTDSALVRGGHAQWEDVGKPIGLPDTSSIAVLTAHSWISLDSIMDPDGSLIRVFRTYYSR